MFVIHSVYPHGRRSIYALLIGIGSYMFLSVSMWSCVYVKIDGYLDAESPFLERVSAEVRSFFYRCDLAHRYEHSNSHLNNI